MPSRGADVWEPAAERVFVCRLRCAVHKAHETSATRRCKHRVTQLCVRRVQRRVGHVHRIQIKRSERARQRERDWHIFARRVLLQLNTNSGCQQHLHRSLRVRLSYVDCNVLTSNRTHVSDVCFIAWYAPVVAVPIACEKGAHTHAEATNNNEHKGHRRD